MGYTSSRTERDPAPRDPYYRTPLNPDVPPLPPRDRLAAAIWSARPRNGYVALVRAPRNPPPYPALTR